MQRLIAAAGVLITNVAGRQWHSYETLRALRSDLIHLEVVGRADGTTGVDYTVNAATGFPIGRSGRPHRTGQPRDAVLGCQLRSLRRIGDPGRPAPPRRHRPGQQPHPPSVGRRRAGNRRQPRLPHRADGQRGSNARGWLGNAIYGQYGRDFTSSDGQSFMVVGSPRGTSGTRRVDRHRPSRRRAGRFAGRRLPTRQPLRAPRALNDLFAEWSDPTPPRRSAPRCRPARCCGTAIRASPRWPGARG